MLELRGINAIHIIDTTHSTAHPTISPARIVDGRLSYALPNATRLNPHRTPTCRSPLAGDAVALMAGSKNQNKSIARERAPTRERSPACIVNEFALPQRDLPQPAPHPHA